VCCKLSVTVPLVRRTRKHAPDVELRGRAFRRLASFCLFRYTASPLYEDSGQPLALSGAFTVLRSIAVWTKTLLLVLVWPLPMLAVRLFDRDPVRYRTGLCFRRLGRAITLANPAWHLTVTGNTSIDPRRPYVVVSNHQSMADIPLISTLPWEMKWLAKEELFRVPWIGWMLRLAGDIRVDRKDARSGGQALQRAKHYLDQKCSVMIFPEGTRSLDGRVRRFSEGAFHLAVTSGTPILPIAIDGTFDCIPKNTWRLGPPSEIRLHVLDPVETKGRPREDVPSVRDLVRSAILSQIARWREVSSTSVDGLNESTRAEAAAADLGEYPAKGGSERTVPGHPG